MNILLNKATTFDSSKSYFWIRHAQVKYNGYRVCFIKDGDLKAFGKDNRIHLDYLKRYPSLHENEVVKVIKNLPDGTAIDTEVISSGTKSYDVVTGLNEGNFSIVPFGVIYLNGEDLSNQSLNKQKTLADALGLPFGEFIKIDTKELVNSVMLQENLLKLAEERNIEGWILKGTIGGPWLKIKKEKTIDAFIVDIVPGKGKYTGMVGSITCAVYENGNIRIIANASGMSDDERFLMSTNKDILGKVVELKYTEVGSKGKLLLPRFIRFRDDKHAKSCTAEQLN